MGSIVCVVQDSTVLKCSPHKKMEKICVKISVSILYRKKNREIFNLPDLGWASIESELERQALCSKNFSYS